MIKKLRNKFIFTAMTAVTILLVFLLGAINIINLIITHNESERMLERCFIDEIRKSDNPPPIFPPINDDKKHFFFNEPITEDNALSARFFSVKLSSDGKVIFTDTERISSVTAEQAQSYAETVIAKNRGSGRFKSFMYLVSEQENETTAFFLDISKENRSTANIFAISLLIGLFCWAATFLLVVILSRAAINPVAENIEKQRQFVTNAGHELKTPLAIILSNTEALEITGASGKSKYTQNIKKQTLRLNELMKNLLTLSRADEDGLKISAAKENISQLIINSAELFKEPAEQRSIAFDENIGENIYADVSREMFTQLISILLDNAVKYSVAESVINISLEKIGKNAVISVENTCEALPDCPPERLFERFYRSDSARNQKSGGSGIGLSAARAIAEAHNGKITALYKNGNRLSFTVSLPIEQKNPKGKHRK